MIDGSEKRNGWLNFELQSPHVIERRSKPVKFYVSTKNSFTENMKRLRAFHGKLYTVNAKNNEAFVVFT